MSTARRYLLLFSGRCLPSPIVTMRAIFVIWLYLILGTALMASTGQIPESFGDPMEIVREFYNAIARRDCAKARELSPDYPQERCQALQEIELRKIGLVDDDVQHPRVHLEVAYTIADEQGPHREVFIGYMALRVQQDRWVIERDAYTSDRRPHVPPPQRSQIVVADAPQPTPELSPQPLSRGDDLKIGSPGILTRLWTLQQLQHNPKEDRPIQRLPVPDQIPPKRLAPVWKPLSPPLAAHRSIRRVQVAPDRQLVALTFDLCEREGEVTSYDAPIVNYLRTKHVPATFFAGGKWLRNHPERAQQLMADPLFEVGNHSWTHGNLRVGRDPQRLDDQIRWTRAQYELLWDDLAAKARKEGFDDEEIARIPRIPLTFRFPYGTCSPEALGAVANAGLPAIQWDVVSGDPSRHQTASQMVEAVLRQVKPGSILIFHANGRGYSTAEALPRIIVALRERGFQFVTVSELLQWGTAVAADECYEVRPGDNRRYDRRIREGYSK